MDGNPYAPPAASLDVGTNAVPGAVVRVGFWPRLGAQLIDGVVVILAGLLIARAAANTFSSYYAYLLLQATAKADPKVAAQVAGVVEFTSRLAIGVGLVSGVYMLGEGLFGRALGKLLLGLRIAEVDGRRASVGRLLGRAACKSANVVVRLLAMATGLFWLSTVERGLSLVVFVGCFFVFAAHRRALHDLAAGTAVYRNSDVT
jgi:uncharacterized RDD family membrane protein YckC